MNGAHKRRKALLGLAGLLALLALALWLRWQYVVEISLYVDEFTTLWAAERVLESGAPVMPSGVLYTRGLLATYVTALAGLLGGGLTYTVGRLPSVILGLASIVASFGVGRREWNSRVGWLAALGLALLPEAIVWSARARFYAQLQFFTLLTLWAAYAAIQYRGENIAAESRPAQPYAGTAHDTSVDPQPGAPSQGDPSARRHLLFAALFVLALFTQEQTVLLYPSILLATLLWRGWRYLLRTGVWPAHAICLAAMAARFVVEILGQPGYFETIQAERPYVGLILDLPAAWGAYASLLIAPERLSWTLFGLLAVAAALIALWRAHGRMAQIPAYHQATLFFTLQFGFVLAFVLLFVGGQWRETRYLFFVQPPWLLVGAAGAVWTIDQVIAHLNRSPSTLNTWRWSATAVAALLAALMLWQGAQAVLSRQVEGYDRVLAYVADHRRPGDVTMTPQPPACAFVLGPCDYYAVQRVYEEFVVPSGLQPGAELVDRWSGAALLNDAAALERVIRNAPAVWLIADRFRLATRYDEAFLGTLIEQFDVAFEERGVLALRAEGWRDRPVLIADESLPTPLSAGPFTATRWAHSVPAAGQEMAITVTWQANAPIDRQINTSFRLLDSAGNVVAQQDGPPARGIISTNLFFGTPLPDSKTLALPAGLAPGEYKFQVVAYDVETVAPVGEPLVVGSVMVGQ
jgi:4-amino-4-deoxy-L-arabinose transferase-like glycosyltransferase